MFVQTINRVFCWKKYRFLTHFLRSISSEILLKEFDNVVRKEIENYWAQRLPFRNSGKKFFISTLLHPSTKVSIEDVRLFTIRDSIVRFHQMTDHQVSQTIYWYFLENCEKSSPQSYSQLQKLIVNFKRQLERFQINFADYEFIPNSIDTTKRTQDLFLKLYHAGLIYRNKTVNDSIREPKTIPNNEYVERQWQKTKAEVSKRWFLKTSQFAEKLYKTLDSSNQSLVDNFVHLHKTLIGACDGFTFECKTDVSEPVILWVQNPSIVPLAEFIAVKPNSLLDVLFERDQNSYEKLQINAVNPFTRQKLPIYVTEKVAYPSGRDTYLGVPSFHENDRKFAESVGLELCDTITKPDALKNMNKWSNNVGIKLNCVNSNLHDWMISQNKQWGTPVPLVHCSSCGTLPIPELQLPVSLPLAIEKLSSLEVGTFFQTSDWFSTTCPKCGGGAERERSFIDPILNACSFSFKYDEVEQFSPVDLLVCRGYQAPLQLCLSRFLTLILNSLARFPSSEPCKNLLLGHVFPNQNSRPANDEHSKFDNVTETASLCPKDRINEIDPMSIGLDDLWNRYGGDTSRLFLLFSPTNQCFQLDSNVQTSILTWQNNLWLTLREFTKIRKRPLAFVSPWIDTTTVDQNLKEIRNEYVRLATFDYGATFDMNSCIAVLRKLTNKLRTYTRDTRKYSVEYEKTLAVLIIMIAPMMPHFAATLWMAFASTEGRLMTNNEQINWNETVDRQKWPTIDEDYEIPIIFRLDSTRILKGGSVVPSKIPSLSIDEALEIGKKSRDVRKFLRKNCIVETRLRTFQNVHAEVIVKLENESS